MQCLNGDINDEVYIKLPKSFNHNVGKIAKLRKSLYGLKSSPKSWYIKFNDVSKLCKMWEWLLYLCKNNRKDDNEIEQIKRILNEHFKMIDLGPIRHFLGMLVTQNLRDNKII